LSSLQISDPGIGDRSFKVHAKNRHYLDKQQIAYASVFSILLQELDIILPIKKYKFDDKGI
jgi:hypothetical protein